MASFTRDLGMDSWVWGSLKPWQILHSTLAERERNGNAPLDHVWELVSETLGADTASTQSAIINSVDEEQDDAPSKGWSHVIRFLADDGEFWRHGGVLEARVREWLCSKDEEQRLQLQLSHAADHDDQHALVPLSDHLQPHVHIDTSTVAHYCSTSELSIASGCTPVQEYRHNNISSAGIYSDQELMVAADQNIDDHEAAEAHQNIRCIRELIDISAEADEEENAGIYDDEDDEESVNTELADHEEGGAHEDNYNYNALIGSGYEDNQDHDGRIRAEGECSILVVNRCCRIATAAAAGDLHDDHRHVQGVAAAKMAEENMGAAAAGPQVMEEEMEMCAVCLEQLNEEEAEAEMQHMMMMSVQALACRHVFHRACIEPWLERQPHACCPCCRAPISTAILARPPLHLAGPLHLATSPMACSGHHHSHAAGHGNDIMGLLADMEAALEHLGFRS